jgi:hypothetical protein
VNRPEFVEQLAAALRLRAVAFDRRALVASVEAAWPLIEDEPDPDLWAREFVAGGNASLTV